MDDNYSIQWEFYFTGTVVSLISGFITIFVLMGGHLYLPWGYALFCLPAGLVASIIGESENKLSCTVFNSIIFSVASLLLLSAIDVFF